LSCYAQATKTMVDAKATATVVKKPAFFDDG